MLPRNYQPVAEGRPQQSRLHRIRRWLGVRHAGVPGARQPTTVIDMEAYRRRRTAEAQGRVR